MKHHIRTLVCGAALLAAIAAATCGGKQTIASKSAAAYDEARKKGIPIASGEHGGHSNEAGAEPMPDMDQSTMTGMDHGAMAEMDHATMPGMQHGESATPAHDMAGMDHSTMGMEHSKMPGMQHGSSAATAHDMTGMNHSAMPGSAHGSMTGIQHGGAMNGMPGMQHGSATAAPIVIPPPTTNATIAQTQPAATLRSDELDSPAPTAIAEAAKAASGMNHSLENATPKPPDPAQHDHKPQPPAAHHHGEAS